MRLIATDADAHRLEELIAANPDAPLARGMP